MGVQYENGNIHSPVIVLGDDPTNPDNVLVSRLSTAVSVPKTSVGTEEGTDEEGNAAGSTSASDAEQPASEGGENEAN